MAEPYIDWSDAISALSKNDLSRFRENDFKSHQLGDFEQFYKSSLNGKDKRIGLTRDLKVSRA